MTIMAINKFFRALLLGAMLCLCVFNAAAREVKIVVMSDLHVLAPSLVQCQGKALDGVAGGDTRLVRESALILQTMTDRILTLKPDVVLVTGDLTHNGELASHTFVAAQLQRLTSAGVQVLVVPGNHDVNNPYARAFAGDSAVAAPTVTPQDFARLYARCGYGPNAVRDTASLSYAVEAAPGLVFLGIDTNCYASNRLKSRGDSVDVYHGEGRISPATWQFIDSVAAGAARQGKRVVAMAHHHIVPHFDNEPLLASRYIVPSPQDNCDHLMRDGIHTLFTGHLHVTDVARALNSQGTDSLTEVATGSMSTFPFHYRVVTISGNTVTVSTQKLQSIPGTSHLQARGKAQIEQAVPGMLKRLVHKAYGVLTGKINGLGGLLGDNAVPSMPSQDQVDQALVAQVAPAATQGCLMVLQGNEGQHGGRELVDSMANLFQPMLDAVMGQIPALSMFSSFIADELYPRVQSQMRSIFEDINGVDSAHPMVVDDLTPRFSL